MHHVFISVLLLFVLIMAITSLLNLVQSNQEKVKTEKSKIELTADLKSEVQSYITEQKLELDLDKIIAADIFFFKNKREVSIILKTDQKDYLLNTTFKNLSPGYGLREKVYELTPPEGIYFVELPGVHSKSGYFLKLDYPPVEYQNYQRLNFEELKKDPVLISEKVRSSSFIQAEANLMKLLVYLSSKLDAESVRILIYPDRPPLVMELGGTEFVSQVYQNLVEEYKKLNVLIESLKPQF